MKEAIVILNLASGDKLEIPVDSIALIAGRQVHLIGAVTPLNLAFEDASVFVKNFPFDFVELTPNIAVSRELIEATLEECNG